MYFLFKTLHLLFVVGWLSCVFVLPRLILLVREGNGSSNINELTQRIYRFGWYMLAALMCCGALLGSQMQSMEDWLMLKLVLVLLLIVYYGISGYLLRRAIRGQPSISHVALRVFNEASLLLVLPILYLALSKYRFGI